MRSLLLVLAALLLSTAANADESVFLVTGRTAQVQIETRQYGDRNVRVYLNVVIPTISPLVQTIGANCAPGLAACENLNLLLGYCWRSKSTTFSTAPWGEQIRTDSYACHTPRYANCVSMSGSLIPGPRVEAIGRASGCQF